LEFLIFFCQFFLEFFRIFEDFRLFFFLLNRRESGRAKAQALQKNDIIVCLFWYAQQQNPYNLETNQCFCCHFFHVDILLLLAKQQQQKSVNLYTISVCYAWALIRAKFDAQFFRIRDGTALLLTSSSKKTLCTSSTVK
jgi:hypothetical protein